MVKYYPLVMTNIANWKITIEIVDFPSYNMVDLSSSLCSKLPEGKSHQFPFNHHFPSFSYGFPLVFLWFSIIFLWFHQHQPPPPIDVSSTAPCKHSPRPRSGHRPAARARPSPAPLGMKHGFKYKIMWMLTCQHTYI